MQDPFAGGGVGGQEDRGEDGHRVIHDLARQAVQRQAAADRAAKAARRPEPQQPASGASGRGAPRQPLRTQPRSRDGRKAHPFQRPRSVHAPAEARTFVPWADSSSLFARHGPPRPRRGKPALLRTDEFSVGNVEYQTVYNPRGVKPGTVVPGPDSSPVVAAARARETHAQLAAADAREGGREAIGSGDFNRLHAELRAAGDHEVTLDATLRDAAQAGLVRPASASSARKRSRSPAHARRLAGRPASATARPAPALAEEAGRRPFGSRPLSAASTRRRDAATVAAQRRPATKQPARIKRPTVPKEPYLRTSKLMSAPVSYEPVAGAPGDFGADRVLRGRAAASIPTERAAVPARRGRSGKEKAQQGTSKGVHVSAIEDKHGPAARAFRRKRRRRQFHQVESILDDQMKAYEQRLKEAAADAARVRAAESKERARWTRSRLREFRSSSSAPTAPVTARRALEQPHASDRDGSVNSGAGRDAAAPSRSDSSRPTQAGDVDPSAKPSVRPRPASALASLHVRERVSLRGVAVDEATEDATVPVVPQRRSVRRSKRPATADPAGAVKAPVHVASHREVSLSRRAARPRPTSAQLHRRRRPASGRQRPTSARPHRHSTRSARAWRRKRSIRSASSRSRSPAPSGSAASASAGDSDDFSASASAWDVSSDGEGASGSSIWSGGDDDDVEYIVSEGSESDEATGDVHVGDHSVDVTAAAAAESAEATGSPQGREGSAQHDERQESSATLPRDIRVDTDSAASLLRVDDGDTAGVQERSDNVAAAEGTRSMAPPAPTQQQPAVVATDRESNGDAVSADRPASERRASAAVDSAAESLDDGSDAVESDPEQADGAVSATSGASSGSAPPARRASRGGASTGTSWTEWSFFKKGDAEAEAKAAADALAQLHEREMELERQAAAMALERRQTAETWFAALRRHHIEDIMTLGCRVRGGEDDLRAAALTNKQAERIEDARADVERARRREGAAKRALAQWQRQEHARQQRVEAAEADRVKLFGSAKRAAAAAKKLRLGVPATETAQARRARRKQLARLEAEAKSAAADARASEAALQSLVARGGDPEKVAVTGVKSAVDVVDAAAAATTGVAAKSQQWGWLGGGDSEEGRAFRARRFQLFLNKHKGGAAFDDAVACAPFMHSAAERAAMARHAPEARELYRTLCPTNDGAPKKLVMRLLMSAPGVVNYRLPETKLAELFDHAAGGADKLSFESFVLLLRILATALYPRFEKMGKMLRPNERLRLFLERNLFRAPMAKRLREDIERRVDAWMHHSAVAIQSTCAPPHVRRRRAVLAAFRTRPSKQQIERVRQEQRRKELWAIL